MGLADKKKHDYVLECFSCKETYEVDDYGKFYRCKKCGDLLEVKCLNPPSLKPEPRRKLDRGVWKYFGSIPLWDEDNIVSLSEGGTILVECRNLGRILGVRSLFVKIEGQNPTGSFKDRGMTVGVSKAVELGYRNIMCASTGNTSASLAAYSARARMRCVVLVPKGRVAMGKIAQAVAYGAEIVQVEGNFDDSLRIASEVCESRRDILLLNSLNPFRIEGQKTLALEVFEQLGGELPDFVVLPVGNGGNITAIWKGFNELLGSGGESKKAPRMVGVQAEGASPIARAFRENRLDEITPVGDPYTRASAINIGSPVRWRKALSAIRDSGGLADSVTDSQIFEAQKLLASEEGVFVEPASATPVAYLSKICATRDSQIYEQMKRSTVVCVATGNGLKDPDAILKDMSPSQFRTIASEAENFETLLA